MTETIEEIIPICAACEHMIMAAEIEGGVEEETCLRAPASFPPGETPEEGLYLGIRDRSLESCPLGKWRKNVLVGGRKKCRKSG